METILVAEDDNTDAFFLARAFGKAGVPMALQFVRDGQEAVDYLVGEGRFANRLAHPGPDLLLMDLKMPRRDGFQVLAWVPRAAASQTPADHHFQFVISGQRYQPRLRFGRKFIPGETALKRRPPGSGREAEGLLGRGQRKAKRFHGITRPDLSGTAMSRPGRCRINPAFRWRGEMRREHDQ